MKEPVKKNQSGHQQKRSGTGVIITTIIHPYSGPSSGVTGESWKRTEDPPVSVIDSAIAEWKTFQCPLCAGVQARDSESKHTSVTSSSVISLSPSAPNPAEQERGDYSKQSNSDDRFFPTHPNKNSHTPFAVTSFIEQFVHPFWLESLWAAWFFPCKMQKD